MALEISDSPNQFETKNPPKIGGFHSFCDCQDDLVVTLKRCAKDISK